MAARIACVTGASRGIGREIALTLARDRYKIIVASNEKENNEAVAGEIRVAGGEAVTQFLDLADADSVKGAFQEMAAAGPISILVNNAGITKDTFAMRMKPQDWSLVLQINLTGAFLCTQQVLQPMMKQRWGRIINISSVVGQAGNISQANYVSSKAGLIGLTKAIAQEMGSRNITVNAVAPGYIDTEMTRVLPEEAKQRMLASVPLRRPGTPADVAAAVRFLVSDEAGYITGQVIGVNGGMYM
jgi:3-oxoacyl-[acyl-carrier protein] reductase